MRSFILYICFGRSTSCRLQRKIGSLLSKCTRRKLRTKFEELMTGPTEISRNDDFTLGVVEGKSHNVVAEYVKMASASIFCVCGLLPQLATTVNTMDHSVTFWHREVTQKTRHEKQNGDKYGSGGLTGCGEAAVRTASRLLWTILGNHLGVMFQWDSRWNRHIIVTKAKKS